MLLHPRQSSGRGLHLRCVQDQDYTTAYLSNLPHCSVWSCVCPLITYARRRMGGDVLLSCDLTNGIPCIHRSVTSQLTIIIVLQTAGQIVPSLKLLTRRGLGHYWEGLHTRTQIRASLRYTTTPFDTLIETK